MRRSADGGTVLFQRIHCWVKEIETKILESGQSSPSVKSALRQLQQDRLIICPVKYLICMSTIFKKIFKFQTVTVIRGN